MSMQSERGRLLDELLAAARVMLQGSLSQSTRTCGRPTCRCHRGERHGPHTYLTFRTLEGRSSALYVPLAELPRFREGVAAWKRFWRVATQLARLNREGVVLDRRAGTGKGVRHARGA